MKLIFILLAIIIVLIVIRFTVDDNWNQIKKRIDRMIYKSHCLLFGHKWSSGDGLCDGDGWVRQRCECGATRMYNVISKESSEENFVFVKAKKYDIDGIVNLVSTYIGTCNIPKGSSRFSLDELNRMEISRDIDRYYVCKRGGDVIGCCGISGLVGCISYGGKEFVNCREILYVAVDKKFRGLGIGTKLLKKCCDDIDSPILYEAWGDGDEKVNSYKILKNNDFEMYMNLGNTYYKDNGYCAYCVNNGNGCNRCLAELWFKNYDTK